jgi:hypothetical protein
VVNKWNSHHSLDILDDLPSPRSFLARLHPALQNAMRFFLFAAAWGQAAQAPLHLTSKEAQERKNTSSNVSE